MGDYTMNHSNRSGSKEHVVEAASDLVNESKKYANELYEQGIHKVTETEESIKEYSDQLLNKVQQNPLTAVLIAGGIGYVLAKIMKH